MIDDEFFDWDAAEDEFTEEWQDWDSSEYMWGLDSTLRQRPHGLLPWDDSNSNHYYG